MPYTKLTHEQARSHICKVCVVKKKCVRVCAPKYEILISKHYRSDLDPQDESLPIGLCDSCRKALGNLESKKAGRDKLPSVDHFDYRYNFVKFKTSVLNMFCVIIYN